MKSMLFKGDNGEKFIIFSFKNMIVFPLLILINPIVLCLNLSCKYLNKTKESVGYMSTYYFYKYSTISDLKFDCSEKFMDFYAYGISLNLEGQERIIFDRSINFNRLFLYSGAILTIDLANFKGFNIQTDIYENILMYDNKPPYFYLDISHSNFDFFYQDILINSDCRLLDSYFNRFFTQVNDITITYSVVFDRKNKYCPSIFKNLSIDNISFEQFYFTFLNKNSMYFINNINSTDNSTKLRRVRCGFFYNDLGTNFLNKIVFQKSVILIFTGIISSIKEYIFKDLKSTRKLYFVLAHINIMFKKPLNWINSLNMDIQLNDDISFTNKVIFVGFKLSDYVLKDEDLCMFKNFLIIKQYI